MNKRSHSQFQRRSRERIDRHLAYLNSTVSHFIDPKSQTTCISLRLPLRAAIILDLYTEYALYSPCKKTLEVPNMIKNIANRIKRNPDFQNWLAREFPAEQISHLGVFR